MVGAFVPPPFVDVGSCIEYAVVAGATITNQGFSIITGDLALSPGSAITGFPPGRVVGTQHITDNAAAACMGDLEIAITDANSRPADATLNGELGGMTLPPGVYISDGGFAITNTLYLDGQNNPVAAWIFIMATTLTVNTGAAVVMLNYDQGNTTGVNAWWTCGERADIFENAAMQGTVMAHQSIAAQDGASTGPLFANIGEVTLLNNAVSASTSFYNPSAGSNNKNSSLSSGAIAGIVIGVVAFVAIAFALLYFSLCSAAAASAGAGGIAYAAPPTAVAAPADTNPV